MSQSAKLSRRKRHVTHHEFQKGNSRCQTQYKHPAPLKSSSSLSLRSPALNRVDIYNRLRVEDRSLLAGSSNGSFTSVMSPVIDRAKLFERFHPGSPINMTRNASRNTLLSPVIYRMNERVGSTSSQNRDSWLGSFEKSHFAQDLDSFKEAHVKKYLSVNYENLMPHFSGSELDTLSTCGQCGQSKIFGSQRLGWCQLEQDQISNILSARNIITDSRRDLKADLAMSREYYISRLESRDSYGSSRKQSLSGSLLCWKGEGREQNMNRETDPLSSTKFVTVMFEYKSENNDLCIKMNDISTVMESGNKPYDVYIKVYLMPGKIRYLHSSIIDKKQTGKDYNFHIYLPFQELSGYDLVIKLCKKQTLLSFSKSIAKTRIPLHRHDFSVPAFTVLNLDQQL